MIVYKCAECGKEFTHRPLWPLNTGGKKARHSTGLSEKAASDGEKHISPARCYCCEKCRYDAADRTRKEKEKKDYERALKKINVSPKDYWKTKKLCMFGGFLALHRWYAGKYFTACAIDLVMALVISAFALGQFSPEFFILIGLDIALWVTDILNLRKGRFRDGKKHPIWPKD